MPRFRSVPNVEMAARLGSRDLLLQGFPEWMRKQAELVCGHCGTPLDPKKLWLTRRRLPFNYFCSLEHATEATGNPDWWMEGEVPEASPSRVRHPGGVIDGSDVLAYGRGFCWWLVPLPSLSWEQMQAVAVWVKKAKRRAVALKASKASQEKYAGTDFYQRIGRLSKELAPDKRINPHPKLVARPVEYFSSIGKKGGAKRREYVQTEAGKELVRKAGRARAAQFLQEQQAAGVEIVHTCSVCGRRGSRYLGARWGLDGHLCKKHYEQKKRGQQPND